jgi:hypothetical protein
MTDIDRSLIKQSIQLKGFSQKPGTQHSDHDIYFFTHNNKRYSQLRVKLSRGSSYKSYDMNLLKKMRKAAGLDTIRQIRDLFECPMSLDEYITILREKRII